MLAFIKTVKTSTAQSILAGRRKMPLRIYQLEEEGRRRGRIISVLVKDARVEDDSYSEAPIMPPAKAF